MGLDVAVLKGDSAEVSIYLVGVFFMVEELGARLQTTLRH